MATTSASGKRTDQYAIEALNGFDTLNAALTAAHLPFQLAGFEIVEDRGYPTFSVKMTAPQAEVLAQTLRVAATRVAPVAMPREALLDLLTAAALIGLGDGSVDRAQTRGEVREVIERRMREQIAGALGEEG